MPRERTGLVVIRNGKVYARVTYTDNAGQRHDLLRRAKNKTHAREIIKQILRDLEQHGERAIKASHKTFYNLAEYVFDRYLGKPFYLDGRKVAGMRTYKDNARYMRTLMEFFGPQRLRDITHGDIEQFKATRLKKKTHRGTQRSIASVNRELALLRRMLNVATREGWIPRNPFNAGDSLISIADERKRERILSREEEEKLLEACSGPRAHLRPIVICALDTGMRRGEIFKLKWPDINFAARTLTVRAFNTKTMRERQVPMTARLLAEVERLYEQSTKDSEALVFGIITNVSKSFAAVQRATGLTDFRFHDLRHTAATRLVQGHLPLAEVGRILGHTNISTTYRYANADNTTLERAAAIMDAFHSNGEMQRKGEELVN